MSFHSITLGPHTLYVPETYSGEDAEMALRALVNAAAPAYNRALQLLERKDIEAALKSVKTSIELAPYNSRFVEFGCVLAIQHGAFEWARAWLAWGRKAGMDADWPDYQEALGEAITRWNGFLHDSSALRAHYRKTDPEVSYRELLLLANRLSTEDISPTETEVDHLKAFSIPVPTSSVPSQTPVADPLQDRVARPISSSKTAAASETESSNSWMTVGIAGLVGLLIGGVGMLGGQTWIRTADTAKAPVAVAPAPSPSGDEPKTEGANPSAVDMLATAQLRLAQENPLEAYRLIDSVSTAGSGTGQIQTIQDKVRLATHQQLYEQGLAAWTAGKTSQALNLLTPIQQVDVGNPQERLYALGMSAAQEGQTALAVTSLQALQKHLTPEYNHYAAQSAYTLVQLLPDADATEYARIIMTRFSGTVYNNSVVQAHQ